MDNEKNTDIPLENMGNDLKGKKNNKVIIFLGIGLIILVIIGIVIALYLKGRDVEEPKKVEIEDFGNTDSGDENITEEDKAVIALSENRINVGTYGFKSMEDVDESDGAGTNTNSNVIYISEGVFEIELISKGSVLIHINDAMGELKLKYLISNNPEISEFQKITETYIQPGMYIRVESIPGVNNTGSADVALRKLDKSLDLVSNKKGEAYSLEALGMNQFYTVGTDIKSGNYDIELTEGDAGAIYIEDLNGNINTEIAIYSSEKLFKDVKLNDGEKIIFKTLGPPMGDITNKYKFISE